MNATVLLIKSLVQEHAEAHPAGRDKSARCQELYSALLADFGRTRLDDFPSCEVYAVRRWLEHEAEPESVRNIRAMLENIREARDGVHAYIRAVEKLRGTASPLIGEALKRLNPAGLPVHDAMAGMLSGGLLDAVQEVRRGMESGEWAAAGLLSLARCLAVNEQNGKEKRS